MKIVVFFLPFLPKKSCWGSLNFIERVFLQPVNQNISLSPNFLNMSLFTFSCIAEILQILLTEFIATRLLTKIYHYHLSFQTHLFLLYPTGSLKLFALNNESHLLHNYSLHTIRPYIFLYFYLNSKCFWLWK